MLIAPNPFADLIIIATVHNRSFFSSSKNTNGRPWIAPGAGRSDLGYCFRQRTADVPLPDAIVPMPKTTRKFDVRQRTADFALTDDIVHTLVKSTDLTR